LILANDLRNQILSFFSDRTETLSTIHQSTFSHSSSFQINQSIKKNCSLFQYSFNLQFFPSLSPDIPHRDPLNPFNSQSSTFFLSLTEMLFFCFFISSIQGIGLGVMNQNCFDCQKELEVVDNFEKDKKRFGDNTNAQPDTMTANASKQGGASSDVRPVPSSVDDEVGVGVGVSFSLDLLPSQTAG
jgi:hypothetical protein